MRPTVNDIAREAGVSLATVDRVMNARPGVRETTVLRVNEAIRRLGYVRDVAAANLARGRNYRMAFVIPDGAGQFLASLRETVAASAAAGAASRTAIETLTFPAEDPHALVRALGDLPKQGFDGAAIMAPETPHVRDAIRALHEKGLKVVALVSDLPNTERDHFVGIDNFAAGRTAGVLLGRFLGPRPAPVMVLATSMQLRESIERRLGFDEVMRRDFPHLTPLQTLEGHDDPDTIARAIGEMLKNEPAVRGVYSLGAGNRALTRTLGRMGRLDNMTVVAHELTAHNRDAVASGAFDAVITQNVGHVVRSALRVLRAHTDGMPIDAAQEQIRIEVVIRENLPAR
ncbi:LacI family DNA-binding transcriptional regulator [Pikeienuella piscinae]|uniref:LacI family DNA-binding transcriptional regulator n=1 Tax=Pikeienuella piscinae TaxID=2748098 RepID=A0A7L5BWJ1_9RHOB|nr:LacI family DNA-binding transcriptional regulator [Pikeienuella piscinae]QIE54606.1 LacI family DNA-binding transcriptional regulator [Pikeienuella piscinae]